MAPQVDYVARANRAIDHILQHLDQPLRLEDVAAAAGFSPFHFHRVFQSMLGETLAQFVRRVRLERALYLHTHDPGRAWTDIALACGFAGSSDFSRAFKKAYGTPPTRFDLQALRRDQGDALIERIRTGEAPRIQRLGPQENPDGFTAEVRELPARRLAYLRVHRPYEGDGVVQACRALVGWAEDAGVADRPWFGYSWDDPDLVPLDRCRYDVAVDITDATPRTQPPNVVDLPAMRVAELPIDGPIELEMRALDWLFRTWLPQSGHRPAAQPCFEAWVGQPFAHGMERFELAIQLAIE